MHQPQRNKPSENTTLPTTGTIHSLLAQILEGICPQITLLGGSMSLLAETWKPPLRFLAPLRFQARISVQALGNTEMMSSPSKAKLSLKVRGHVHA